MRLSPKYFRIRTTLLLSSIATLGLAVTNCFFVAHYLTADPTPERDFLWIMLSMIVLNLLFGFVTVIAYKTYRETFWNGDKAVWKNSKWRFIKRFLLEL